MTDWLRQQPDEYEALCLHGDKRQEERDFALNEFRKVRLLALLCISERAQSNFPQGGHPILLATDVAQRGLDIEGVTVVCNFGTFATLCCSSSSCPDAPRLADVPDTIAAYVHRCALSCAYVHTPTDAIRHTASVAPLVPAMKAARSPLSPAVVTAVRFVSLSALVEALAHFVHAQPWPPRSSR